MCCGGSKLEKITDYSSTVTVFKCLVCGLYLHAAKECCYYNIYAMPRDTRYNGGIAISKSLSFNCVICGKPADTHYYVNPLHRANRCVLYGAMMHISNGDCDRGFFRKYCPDCEKYLVGEDRI